MMFLGVGEEVLGVFRKLGALLIRVLFELMAALYNLFIALSKISLFENKDIAEIYKRVEIILAVVMVFYVSFQFIKYIVNPDTFTDKEKGAPGLVKKMIIVVFLMAFGTTIFSEADSIKNSIIENRVIPQLLFDSSSSDREGKTAGYNFAATLMQEFYRPTSEKNLSDKDGLFVDFHQTVCPGDISKEEAVTRNLKSLREYGKIDLAFCMGTYAENEKDENVFLIELDFFYALVVGIFIDWVFINYCVEAARVVFQIALLEIIAPIPIISYLSPDKDGMFQKWGKQVLSTYLDLIVRLFIIYLMLFFSKFVLDKMQDIGSVIKGLEVDSFVEFLIKLFLIIGLLYFAMLAPKLIKELLPKGMAGLSGSFGLGAKSAKERFNPSARAAGAALGATRGVGKGLARGVGAFGRNLKENGLSPKKNAKAFARSIKAGARRTAKRAKNAVDRAFGNDEASKAVKEQRRALDNQLAAEAALKKKNGLGKLRDSAMNAGLNKSEREEFATNNARMSLLSKKKAAGTITADETLELANLKNRQKELYSKVQDTQEYKQYLMASEAKAAEMKKYLDSNKGALSDKKQAKNAIDSAKADIESIDKDIDKLKTTIADPNTSAEEKKNAMKEMSEKISKRDKLEKTIITNEEKVKAADKILETGGKVAEFVSASDAYTSAKKANDEFMATYDTEKQKLNDSIAEIKKAKSNNKIMYDVDGTPKPIDAALSEKENELKKLEDKKTSHESKLSSSKTELEKAKRIISSDSSILTNVSKEASKAASLEISEKIKDTRKAVAAAEAVRAETYAREKQEMRDEANAGYHSVIKEIIGGTVTGAVKGATQGFKSKEITKVIPDYVKGVKEDIKNETERHLFVEQGGTTGVTATVGRAFETVKHAIGVGTTSEQLQSSIKPLQQVIEVDKKIVDANSKATSSYNTAKSTLASAREGNKLSYVFSVDSDGKIKDDEFRKTIAGLSLASGGTLRDAIPEFDTLRDTRQIWQALKNRAEILDAKFKAFSELKAGDVGYIADDTVREATLTKMRQAYLNAQDDEKKFSTQVDRKVATLYLDPSTRNSSNLKIDDPGVRTSIDNLVSTLRAALDNPSTYAGLMAALKSRGLDVSILNNIKKGEFSGNGITMDYLNDLNDMLGVVNQGISDKINEYGQRIEMVERAAKDAKLQEDGPKSGGDGGKK